MCYQTETGVCKQGRVFCFVIASCFYVFGDFIAVWYCIVLLYWYVA